MDQPWTEDVDKTVRECMRGIRSLAGDIAGDIGGEEYTPGSRCSGHEKLVNSLADAIVKITDAKASHIVLQARLLRDGPI